MCLLRCWFGGGRGPEPPVGLKVPRGDVISFAEGFGFPPASYQDHLCVLKLLPVARASTYAKLESGAGFEEVSDHLFAPLLMNIGIVQSLHPVNTVLALWITFLQYFFEGGFFIALCAFLRVWLVKRIFGYGIDRADSVNTVRV
jgi:hypothetical protein